ncbi:hypothetical protein GCK72_022267 [Caenorhabditis remanei]|uniref:Uncharacterized protein n=1 Tax=Caenorhabditis remanei TaxID=31234 RepID=A0A6A5FTA1_CAERE|nr:hypothetical protein GCK72_022267 [Caenorhabditis remanei]KAF1745820.1 hypothetical protein GCK72_022267 [Caenorhabditis remanei]
MEANVVPTQYNRCVCDLIVENGELENLSNQELKCTPNYRNFRVASASSTSSVQPAYSQKHSWIDGFRSNIMQLYRKPDGHLRFG